VPLPRSDIPLTLAVTASHRHVSDADVGRGLIAGQSWAIAETWHRFAPMVLTTAERALGSRAEAQDVAQEVFCRLYRKARTLREPESLRSFVFSFAIRVLKSELRSRKTRGWLSFHRPEALLDVGSDTLDVESRDLLRRFYARLDRLSPEDRLVFALRHLESMTVEEIGAALELSTSTVKRRLAHGTARISRMLESEVGLAGRLPTRGGGTT